MAHILTAIHVRMQLNWDVTVTHILKEANYSADKLARIAASQPQGVHVLLHPSDELLFWLKSDSVGGSVLRLVTH